MMIYFWVMFVISYLLLGLVLPCSKNVDSNFLKISNLLYRKKGNHWKDRQCFDPQFTYACVQCCNRCIHRLMMFKKIDHVENYKSGIQTFSWMAMMIYGKIRKKNNNNNKQTNKPKKQNKTNKTKQKMGNKKNWRRVARIFILTNVDLYLPWVAIRQNTCGPFWAKK